MVLTAWRRQQREQMMWLSMWVQMSKWKWVRAWVQVWVRVWCRRSRGVRANRSPAAVWRASPGRARRCPRSSAPVALYEERARISIYIRKYVHTTQTTCKHSRSNVLTGALCAADHASASRWGQQVPSLPPPAPSLRLAEQTKTMPASGKKASVSVWSLSVNVSGRR